MSDYEKELDLMDESVCISCMVGQSARVYYSLGFICVRIRQEFK